MQHWLLNARVFTGTEWLAQAHVCIEDDRIARISTQLPDTLPEHFDCQGMMLVPAFLDAQIYGGGSRLFAQYPEPESLALLAADNRHGGTAQCLVTIPTLPMHSILNCLDALNAYMDEGGDGILGLHLEGPFIHPDKRGAHTLADIRQPTADDVNQILYRAQGHLKMITLAPEQCSDEVLCLLSDAGVIISAGHSNATYEQAQQFASRGVKTVTHLFNAMSALHHRAPGLPAAVFESNHLMASIIPDGIHVHYSLLRMAKQLMGERLFYITDAVTPTNEGPYQHVLNSDHYALPNGTLSGSSLSMLQAVVNGIKYAGIAPEESLRMASLYPAQLLGIDADYGSIAEGKKASLLLLNEEWQLVKVFGF
jgi:N-acetylglucosamine-6-phosphate deacetylase